MPVQAATAYTTEHVVGYEGAVVDGQLTNVHSLAAEVAIPFGRVVTRGTGANQCKLPTSAGEVTAAIGIAIRVQDEVANASDVLQNEIGKDVNICDFGVVWMVTEAAVVKGGAVFVRHTAAGAEELGRVRDDADGTDATVLPGAEFVDAAGDGELVRVMIRRIPA